jgi:ABC-type sugar transport system ATPase subunit
MNRLSIEHVWKQTEINFELKNVSFSINEDEWLLISGPFGQGKETLQKILLGFELNWKGTILLNNESIKDMVNYNEKIAFIHNHLQLENGRDSIYDYLAFPLRLSGVSEKIISQEINNTLQKFSFSVKIEREMKTLSLQEKVIVAFVRAALMKPSLIVIDEPFYQLPNSKRKLIIATMKERLRFWKGCPVIIFSSYVLEWLHFCDRIAVINKKKLLQIGGPSVLLEEPEHVFVAKYLSGDGITFLSGYLKDNLFITSGISFFLPEELLHKKELYEGQKLLLGIKLTSFQVLDKHVSSSEGVHFEAPIHILEEEGGYYKIYSNLGSQPLVAQIKKSGKIDKGERVRLFFHYKDILFFDGNTEKRLMQRG